MKRQLALGLIKRVSAERRRDRLWEGKNTEKMQAYKKAWNKRNHEKKLEIQRAWREKNPDKIKIYNERRKKRNHVYDLARWKRDGYPLPTRERPTVCECCGKPPRGKWGKFHLDHCHISGVFRGWLCSKCNLGIGALGDNADGVMQALKYLQRVAA